MIEKQRPIVHIGMAKAASTFLQLEVFPSLSGYVSLGKHFAPNGLKSKTMGITRLTSIDWPRLKEPTRQAFQQHIKDAREKGMATILSDEDFSVYKFLDPEIMARRLRYVLGPYDVILMVRNPFTWLESNFLFRLAHQNSIAVFGFNEWLSHHLGTQRIGSDIAEIWYGSIASVYSEHSGGNIHIVPYELLRVNPDQFSIDLATILGIDTEGIRSALSAPERRLAHKIRITESQRKLFETFRWVELKQPERFRDSVDFVVTSSGKRLSRQYKEFLQAYADGNEFKRKELEAFLIEISRTLPSSDSPAELHMSFAHEMAVQRVMKHSLHRLEQEFSFSLDRFGIKYLSPSQRL